MLALIDGHVDPLHPILREPDEMQEWLTSISDLLGLHRLSEPVVWRYPERLGEGTSGLTGIVPLMESHAIITTYPEFNAVLTDIFSCRDFDEDALISYYKGQGFDCAARVYVARGVSGGELTLCQLRGLGQGCAPHDEHGH